MNENNDKVVSAIKWSTITEIVAKLVTPISNMILARLLTPEAFGIVATATMVFSFADMLSDSGFQKYLVQHEFKDENELAKSTTVAFWTNLFISIVLWLFITIFSEQISAMVGNPGLGIVIIISCLSLPLTSFSSIHMALYRRKFDYKTLFLVRLVSVIIPIFITVPLAFITRSFWALIIGTLCGNIVNTVLLTVRSSWKPVLYFKFDILKEMISFSIWSLFEAISIWLTNYIGVFIVGAILSPYYVGLYKTAMNTVNQIMNLVTAATTTVLFSALSRTQNNQVAFEKTFFSFQRNVSLLILPMGVGVFCFRDFVTSILLGNQWAEAAGFIGLWSVVNSIKIILSNFCSEAYRAVGKPRVSLFVQISQLIFLIPAIVYGASKNFETLYFMRCTVSLELILINLIIVRTSLKISSIKMIKNILPEIIASAVMGILAYCLSCMSDSFVLNITFIILCVIIYFGVILVIPQSRRDTLQMFKKIFLRGIKNEIQ